MKKFLIAAMMTCTLMAATAMAGEQTAGGWQAAKDPAITEQAKDVFDKAVEGSDKEYEPVSLLATQVVAGTNYCFLCQTGDDAVGYALVYVYADLKGDASILGVKDITFGEGILEEEETAVTGQFGIRQVSGTYFVTTDELNVRSGYSTDDAAIGAIYYGEPVTVTGAVTKDGADYGWYQIQFNGATGYVASGFLSETQPAAKTAGTAQAGTTQTGTAQAGTTQTGTAQTGTAQAGTAQAGTAQSGTTQTGTAQTDAANMEQCQYCGEWFVVGDAYRDHLLGHANENLYAGKVQCEYCGDWFDEGNDYRNHVMAAHSGE